jgi:hypothetical protein
MLALACRCKHSGCGRWLAIFAATSKTILSVRYDAAALMRAHVTPRWCKDRRREAHCGALGSTAMHCGALRSISGTSGFVLLHPGSLKETEESGTQDKEDFSFCAFLLAALDVFANLI